MRPSVDPNSTKYPERTFYAGQWRTPQQIEAQIERVRKWKREKASSDPKWIESERKRKRDLYRSNPEYAERERERHRKANMTREQVERMRKRNLRQVRIRAGGIQFYLGLAPTQEAAGLIRKSIKELPSGAKSRTEEGTSRSSAA